MRKAKAIVALSLICILAGTTSITVLAGNELMYSEDNSVFEIKIDEDTVFTDPEIIKAVQQALNDAGYDCGSPDGIIGNKTRSAINSFESDHGLPVDGVITYGLLIALELVSPEVDTPEIAADKLLYSQDYLYEDIAKDPNYYYGLKMSFDGAILRSYEEGPYYWRALLASDGNADEKMYITYSTRIIDTRVNTGDYILFYGTCLGSRPVESETGENIVVPWFNLDMLFYV